MPKRKTQDRTVPIYLNESIRTFSPAELWLDGIKAHNRGEPRDSLPFLFQRSVKARIAFQRGWDSAAKVARCPACPSNNLCCRRRKSES